MADGREPLIRNEQAKLTATYLNGIAIAGGIAPWLAAAETATISPVRSILTIGCFGTSLGIPWTARRVLRAMVV